MKDALDRWVDLEGPEPDDIRELLDAACDVPDMTPEQDERMTRTLFAAIAEDRRRWARRRALRRGLYAGLAAAGLAAAVTIGIHLAAPIERITAHRLRQGIEDLWVAKVAPR
jgi:hypothetical protein